jgi:hypothetical protein
LKKLLDGRAAQGWLEFAIGLKALNRVCQELELLPITGETIESVHQFSLEPNDFAHTGYRRMTDRPRANEVTEPLV